LPELIKRYVAFTDIRVAIVTAHCPMHIALIGRLSKLWRSLPLRNITEVFLGCR
jgi:hypothetical protein